MRLPGDLHKWPTDVPCTEKFLLEQIKGHRNGLPKSSFNRGANLQAPLLYLMPLSCGWTRKKVTQEWARHNILGAVAQLQAFCW